MKKLRMKTHVFLILLTIFGLIVGSLSLSLCSRRYTSGPIYRMMDEFYVIAGFMDAFDDCEKHVTGYRWSEGGIYDPDIDGQIRDRLDEMKRYLDLMVLKLDVKKENQYFDIRALSHMFPHYQEYIGDFLEKMEAGVKTDAVSSYYQRETIVALIHDYASQMLGDTVQESQKNYDHTQKVTKILWFFQVLTGIVLVMVSAYFAAMLHEIVQPISRLAEASEAMRHEDFDIPDVPVEVKNAELRQLMISFNHMKHSTKRYVETLKKHNQTLELLRKTEKQALESQRLAEEAKLLSLRGQVNPHFLFNALNTIRRIAQREQAPETEALIMSLSKVFRRSLYHNNALTTLTDEMDVTQEYFRIQQARFGDRIHLAWEISEDIESDEVVVPSFILEILVENAVRHGLEPKAEGGRIRIQIRIEDGMLVMVVEDDGSGMTRETLDQVRKGERPAGADSGIGLSNIYHRLRLLDRQNRLIIQSEEDQGTSIMVRMPVQYREEVGF